MQPQAMALLDQAYWYALQPGDGTRYQFGIIEFDAADSKTELAEMNDKVEIAGRHPYNLLSHREEDVGIGDVVQGVGAGHRYVMIIVNMPSSSGCYPIMKSSLDNVDKALVNYYIYHTNDSLFPSTVAAILLAASVLYKMPYNLAGAVEKMLEWPKVLS